jgi:hypothetical protein
MHHWSSAVRGTCDPNTVSKSRSKENAMHGQIGELNRRVENRGGLDFYYRTRAALSDARRQLGTGYIDYDFYRARARTERNRVRCETLKSLMRFIRPLVAVAAIAAAIWMMPAISQDCASCGAHAAHTFTGLQ